MKNDVVLGLQKFAAGQIDELELRRLLTRELELAPGAASDILSAIAAAKSAGNIDAIK